MDRPVLRGTPQRRPGARALRPVAVCRVPVPCRAVRKLVGADLGAAGGAARRIRAGGWEEHTSELKSLMRTCYAVFCLKKKKLITLQYKITYTHANTNATHTH